MGKHVSFVDSAINILFYFTVFNFTHVAAADFSSCSSISILLISRFCIGDRPFQGMHSLSITPSTSDAYDYILFAGFQAALFQDGSSPTYFSESATRVLTYGLTSPSGDNRRETTATYINSFRYDTSHLTLESYHKSARHFNALFGMLALNETSLLMIETEDLTGFSYRKIVNRIFYVEVDSSATVDHCPSLLNCDIDAPTKYLVWERCDDHHLDGISWGPELDDGRLTVALTFEKDGTFKPLCNKT